MAKHRTILAAFLVLILVGCAPAAKQIVKPEAAPPPARSLPRPAEKMEEIVVSNLEEKKEPERLLTFSLREADIREVLLSISKILNRSIVLDPDVSGKITVDVKRVTVDEALGAFLSPLALQYQQEKNYIRVFKMKKETRVFPLSYITSRRSGTTSVVSSLGVGGTTAAGTAGGGGISSTSTADPWADIETGLKALASEGGRVVVNRMGGFIIATDFITNLNHMARFLEEMEGSIQRQVMIQARLVDVSLNDEFRLGLDWAAISKISALNLKGTLAGGMIVAQSLTPSTSVFQVGLSDTDFSALFKAMALQGTVNILSTPRISVLNNQKAVIKATRSEVYYEVRTDIDPISRVERISPVPRTVDVGVVLEVVPQISADGQIIMDIHPVITDKVRDAPFESGTLKLTTPVLAVRESNSVVKIQDGQTLILAGLIQEKTDHTETSVPGLSRLPLIGPLFKKTEKVGMKTELVAFITPTVLTGKRIEDLSQKELAEIASGLPDSKMKESFLEDLSRKNRPAK